MPSRARRTGHIATGLTATVVIATGLLTAPAHAESGERSGAGADRTTDRTQQALERVVEGGKPPGIAATAQRGARTWQGAAGLGDLDSGSERANDDHFRVGSITKTFVATVLLQLEAEGELSLDDSVEKWLPGLIKGNGNDGSAITVRQLLQHTSGLADYTVDEEFGEKHFVNFFDHRYDRYKATDLVDVALQHEPVFAPGDKWQYSNTGYVVAGLVIEAVTGERYAEQIRERLINPLKLKSTSVPGTKVKLPGPHAVGYSLFDSSPDAKLSDVTKFSPTIAGAAGEMISTEKDLNRFYRALVRGELLPEAQQKAMFNTVPVEEGADSGYGLGLMSTPLSCGIDVWGHGGGIHGSMSEVFATEDGDELLSVNVNADVMENPRAMAQLAEVEFCDAAPEELTSTPTGSR